MKIAPQTHRLEFIFIMVALLSVGALAIDIMLPSLPQIALELGVTDPTAQQYMLTFYLIGFGASQLFWGPLSDSFGRLPIIKIGLLVSLVPVAIAPFVDSYDTMLMLRLLQGVGAGAARVLSTTIIRDNFSGNQMAKIMSLTTMIYMAIPIVAPSVGQLIILFGTWQHTFFVMAFVTLLALIWSSIRLPETLTPKDKRPFKLKPVLTSFSIVLRTRKSLAFTTANMMLFATLIGFLGLSPQIYLDIYDLGAIYPLLIAATAINIAIASFINARIVDRFGPARIAYVANIAFIALTLVWVGVALSFGEIPLWLFITIHQPLMLCLGFAGGNQISVAMQPLGHVAGTASSTVGFFHTTGGALFGALMGNFFNGSILPVTIGFLIFGLLSLAFMSIGLLGQTTEQAQT